jgi:hypothetical protein
MKNPTCLITALFIMCFGTMASAQKKEPLIKMTSDPQPWGSQDIYRLASWQGIHYDKVKFSGKALKGKHYYVATKEIWNGEIKNIDTLFNTKTNKYFEPVKIDTLSFALMSGKSSNRSVKMEFIFDRLSINNQYLAIDSEAYSMRALDMLSDIKPGKPFYAFAFILPFEKDGNKYYCAVEISGKDIEKWGTEFGLEHYILVEMCFFD